MVVLFDLYSLALVNAATHAIYANSTTGCKGEPEIGTGFRDDRGPVGFGRDDFFDAYSCLRHFHQSELFKREHFRFNRNMRNIKFFITFLFEF